MTLKQKTIKGHVRVVFGHASTKTKFKDRFSYRWLPYGIIYKYIDVFSFFSVIHSKQWL